MRASILLSALGALALSMSDADAQESPPREPLLRPPGSGQGDSVEASDQDPTTWGPIGVDPAVWTTAGARVPSIDLPRVGDSVTRAASPPGWTAANLYDQLRTVDDERPDGALPKRTLLIQFASW